MTEQEKNEIIKRVGIIKNLYGEIFELIDIIESTEYEIELKNKNPDYIHVVPNSDIINLDNNYNELKNLLDNAMIGG